MRKTVDQWLIYMQSIHISAIDMGLERVLPVAKQLNLFEVDRQKYVFTVAGTNGKGSTTAVIAEICQQAGYNTGLYQSPHLIDFNERIQVNGVPIADSRLVEAFEQVEQARLDCGLSLSFFEMTSLAGFLIFDQQECDVWVLEIGLGGRLDVVNIIEPNMTVITNIAVDHIDWLGDDREKIGYEKAGILRQKVPLIFGDGDMPKSVKDRIERLAVRCYQRGSDFEYVSSESLPKEASVLKEELDFNHWQYSNAGITLNLTQPKLSLINASNAITAVLASDLSIDYAHIEQAMQSVQLAGRFDYRCIADRRWLFDVAHNEAGVHFLLAQLQSHLNRFIDKNSQIHIIFSMLKDKDIDKVVALISQNQIFIDHKVIWHIAPIDDSYCPRVSTLERLYGGLIQYVADGDIQQYQSLQEATYGAVNKSQKEDFIMVCGSFYTISECLIAIKN